MFLGFRTVARLGRARQRPSARQPLFLESLEHRLALTTSPYYTMPIDLQAKQGSAVTVPVSISALFDIPGAEMGNQGLHSGQIVLTYNTNVFSVADADVTEGAVLTNPPTNNTWTFTVNTATPGEIDISLASPSLAADLGRSGQVVLANVNFHVKTDAPEGESGIRVIVFPRSSPNGLSSTAIPDTGPYSVRGDGSGYSLNAADQQDGIVTVLNARDQPATFTSNNSATFTAGVFNSFTVTTSGTPNPYFYIAAGGLSGTTGMTFVDNGDGTATFSGTPALGSGGVYNFDIVAVNGVDPVTNQPFTLTVNEAPSIVSANNTTFFLRGGFFSIQAYGYPSPTLTVTGTLPATVRFKDSSNGTPGFSETVPRTIGFLQGTFGEFHLTITASNGLAPTATQQFTVTVTGIPSYATNPNQRFVAQSYLDVFHSVADPVGVVYWASLLDQGVSRAQVVLDLERDPSNVFQKVEVEQLYLSYLHRPADDSGLYNFIRYLDGPGNVPQTSAIIIGSPEYFQNRAGGTNQGFLEALYQDVLKRPIDPGALAFGLSYLGQGGDRTQFALFVLNSQEADQLLVESTYEAFLVRKADTGGLAYFTQVLRNGAMYEQLVGMLMGSQEYAQNRVGAM